MIGSFYDRIHDRIRDRERDGGARVAVGAARPARGRAAERPKSRARGPRKRKDQNLSHFSRVQISTPCSTRQSNRQASEAKLGFHLGFTHMDDKDMRIGPQLLRFRTTLCRGKPARNRTRGCSLKSEEITPTIRRP